MYNFNYDRVSVLRMKEGINMFDKITYISNDGCDIKLLENAEVTTNLMNLHLVFEDENKKVWEK